MSTNSERAARARKAVREEDPWMRCDLVDLVTDLLHLADAEGDSGERVLRLAAMHYTEECLEERGVS